MHPTPSIAIAALLAALVAIPAQDDTPRQAADAGQDPQRSDAIAESAAKFSEERLEQLVAPIALYPDPLLSQILISSTYPLEIVEAERWIQQNPGLSGSALEEALKTQSWDPSVKSLCGFPSVLKRLDEDLTWTRDLGDAFLAQKTELMDAVQRMRKQALDAGNLKSTEQQKVVQENGAISIQPASPEVIYVPTYSPVVVYGPGWYYPYWYYPYWYYPPPPGAGFVTFSVGFFWGSACWSHCDWHQHVVIVDVPRYRTFHERTSAAPLPPRFAQPGVESVAWTHDPVHRASVAYRSPSVARTYGGEARPPIFPERRDPMGPMGPLRPTSPGSTPPGSTTPSPFERPAPVRPSPVQPVPARPAPARPLPPSPTREHPIPPSSPGRTEVYRESDPGWSRGFREPGIGSRTMVDGFRRHRAP